VTGRSSVGETQPVQQLRGARPGTIAVNGFEALLCIEPCRVVIFLRQRFCQRPQLHIAVEHERQRGLIGAGDLLFDERDGLAGLHRNLAAVRLDLAAYQAKQR
jgi:hypothetical protein